jgi:hypothetical protein
LSFVASNFLKDRLLHVRVRHLAESQPMRS